MDRCLLKHHWQDQLCIHMLPNRSPCFSQAEMNTLKHARHTSCFSLSPSIPPWLSTPPHCCHSGFQHRATESLGLKVYPVTDSLLTHAKTMFILTSGL